MGMVPVDSRVGVVRLLLCAGIPSRVFCTPRHDQAVTGPAVSAVLAVHMAQAH